MPDYQVIVRTTKVNRGQRIDKGMIVYVHSNKIGNPILVDKAAVALAFSVRGVDINALGALNTAYLDVKKIG